MIVNTDHSVVFIRKFVRVKLKKCSMVWEILTNMNERLVSVIKVESGGNKKILAT